jgi:uncharacterized protein (DUF952 family)
MTSPILPPANAAPLTKQGHTTYHLVPSEWWQAQHDEPSYLPERFADEGFIHCTDTLEEIIAVGNRYYTADSRPFLLLDIDCAAVEAPIVYEDPNRIFPHIYGPLEVDAVTRVRLVVRDERGCFLSIGD